MRPFCPFPTLIWYLGLGQALAFLSLTLFLRLSCGVFILLVVYVFVLAGELRHISPFYPSGLGL